VRLKDKKFGRVINISLNETMGRTLLTSITLFVVTLMMNILGTGLVKNFAFAMNIGVVVGVYSSVFIASPVALGIHNKWFAGPAQAKK
jgi:preprotein translocase subunit SecF